MFQFSSAYIFAAIDYKYLGLQSQTVISVTMYTVSPKLIWNKLERFTTFTLDQLAIRRSQSIPN